MLTTHATWTDWVESGRWAGSSDTSMPMLPALAGEVMALVLDPDVSVISITRVISKDQVLATRILRLANAAYCAPMQEVTTINEAIVRMGTSAARGVVLAVCFASRLQEANVYGPQGRELVDHAIGTAYLARLVSEHVGVDVEEAFMVGLLHDLGKLLLLKLARDFLKLGGPTPSQAELEAVMRDRHAAIGARLMEQWQLPPALKLPVRFHHDPDACEDFPDEAAVAYVADRLSHRYGFGCAADDADLTRDPICRRLRVTEPWLSEVDRRAPGLFQIARQIVG